MGSLARLPVSAAHYLFKPTPVKKEEEDDEKAPRRYGSHAFVRSQPHARCGTQPSNDALLRLVFVLCLEH